MNFKNLDNNHQIDSAGKLVHLLGLNGLPKKYIENIIDCANNLLDKNGKLTKSKALDDMSIANLFFEPSTRTRNTFEIAAKRSSAKVINIDIVNSATKKNETLIDTMHTLKAMQIDMFVIRHNKNKLPHMVAKNISGIRVINAGDGVNAHPTQALLDIMTIIQKKGAIDKLSIAIVGDICHSRVAHSNIRALLTLGVKDIRLIAPDNFQYKHNISSAISLTSNLEQGLAGVDVIIALRLQKERILASEIPDETIYFKNYGITLDRLKLAKPDVIVMHPGPVNRGIELDSGVLDSKHSVILQQVTNGIAIRMAVMQILAKSK